MTPADGGAAPLDPQAANAPTVSLCIPTWRSQPFIADTLRQALAQTWPHLRVLVSVDTCYDGTADICADIARRDDRVDLLVQPDRLGWAGNVNALLERVRTDYFSLYFHDDRIDPGYVERLLRALHARPDAVSVHCDMAHFGASEHVSYGVAYPDALAQRLAWFFVAPNRGSPLRSLTRARLVRAGLRLPTAAVGGLWANEPYLVDLLAAGPALHVPEPLYQRWDQRAGGLTDGWRKLRFDQQLDGYRTNASLFLATVDAAPVAADERDALRLCVRVNVVSRLRDVEAQYARPEPLAPVDIHPAFAAPIDPAVLASLGPQLEAWARDRLSALGGSDASRDALLPLSPAL